MTRPVVPIAAVVLLLLFKSIARFLCISSLSLSDSEVDYFFSCNISLSSTTMDSRSFKRSFSVAPMTPTPQPIIGDPFSGLNPAQPAMSMVAEQEESEQGQLCRIPLEYVSATGLLCLKGNVQTNTDGKNVINQLQLCRFYRKEFTGDDGHVYSLLQEPKWPLKFNLDEAEALKDKLECMVTAAKAINERPSEWISSLELAETIRKHSRVQDVSDHELIEAADNVDKMLMQEEQSQQHI